MDSNNIEQNTIQSSIPQQFKEKVSSFFKSTLFRGRNVDVNAHADKGSAVKSIWTKRLLLAAAGTAGVGVLAAIGLVFRARHITPQASPQEQNYSSNDNKKSNQDNVINSGPNNQTPTITPTQDGTPTQGSYEENPEYIPQINITENHYTETLNKTVNKTADSQIGSSNSSVFTWGGLTLIVGVIGIAIFKLSRPKENSMFYPVEVDEDQEDLKTNQDKKTNDQNSKPLEEITNNHFDQQTNNNIFLNFKELQL